MNERVQFVDLRSAHAEIADEVAAGWRDVIERTDFAGGEAVATFEEAFARYCGVAAVAGVANGTDALQLALRASGIGPGDEVVVPVNTFIASAEAVSLVGAEPVFVDVDPKTLLIDPAAVEAALTSRTAAILPVHLYGRLVPMEPLQAIARGRGLVLVEDAAQAQGASASGQRAGSLGDVAATSFYPGKNLGAYGEAGAVLTDDAVVIEKVRRLRNHGSTTRYVHDIVGTNSRMDSLQAVVLTAKLARLDAWNERRRDAAAIYEELLADVPGIELPPSAGDEHVWHLYVVQVPDRDRAVAALRDAGIGCGVHYPVPLHLQAAYADLGIARGTFPVAEEAAGRILSLPMHPHLTQAHQELVREALAAAAR